MQWYVLNDVISDWQAQLAQTAPESVPLEQLLALCWHLRQRDAKQALHWMALARSRSQPGQSDWMRLDLIEAEIALLRGDVDGARSLCERLRLATDSAKADPLLESDYFALETSLHMHAGQSALALQSLAKALASAQRAGDGIRAQCVQLLADIIRTYQDPVAGKARGAPDDEAIAAMPTGLALWAHELRGTLAAQSSDYGRAAAERILAFEEGLQSGQVARAVVAALNASAALNSLNEYELALQWLERGMSLAREKAWPLPLANCLALMGETQRCLGQFESARQSLDEALQILAPLPKGRSYAIALKYLGDLDMNQDRLESALARFKALQQSAQADSQPDLVIYAYRGQAQALSKLAQWEAAEQLARAALQLAKDSQNVYRQIDALRTLASTQNPLLRPQDTQPSATNLRLECLQQALVLAQGIQGYQIPGELWEELAQACADSGDLPQAYALMRQAGPAHRKIQSDAATQRMLAMQVVQQAERARSEAQARRLAQEQRQREERLAAMSRMVAGVAHELNTPLGNCLVVASTLHNSSVRIAGELQAQTLKRSEMQAYLQTAQQASDLMMQSLTRAAQLVQRFKEVAVDPTSEIQQRFALLPLCQGCINACRAQSEKMGVDLILEVPDNLQLESFPSALQQVIGQLLANALQHAFEGLQIQAWLRLRAKSLDDGTLQLEVCDNGRGIPPEHQRHVFDAFYSTRFGQGGSGLGLHICHNIITSVLGGSITVHSQPNQGCCFELRLPLKPLDAGSR